MPSDESKGSQLDAIGSLAQRQLDNTILRHHRTFALLRRKVQSNGRFRGCAVRGLQLVLQPI